MNDADPLCYTWDLDDSVLEEDNVVIPTDDNIYFYIKVLVKFTCVYVSDFDDGESFLNGNLVDAGEEEDSFLILREKLLSDDQAVVREAISEMTLAMGVPPPNYSITDPITEMARSKVRTSNHMKVIPFSVQINVEDYVEGVPDAESESELSVGEIERMDLEEEEQNGEAEAEEESEQNGEEDAEAEQNGSTEVETCAICIDDVAVDGRRGTEKMECCKHAFHMKCIKKWRRVKDLCPLCRSEIPN